MTTKESILRTIGDFPPFPQIAVKATKLLKDPESSAADLVNIIQYDPQITANILRFANSAYFGIPNRVRSLGQAVTLLGARRILDLLFMSSVVTYFGQDFSPYALSQKDMLVHSVVTALLCRNLAERMALRDTSEAFTAGLLHDIGKVVLSAFLLDKQDEIKRILEDPEIPFIQAERETLGIDHAQVGRQMALKWGLPEEIAAPIGGHHAQPGEFSDDLLTSVVFLADRIFFLLHRIPGADHLSFERIKQALNRCKLAEADLDASILMMRRSWGAVQALIFT